ncbi:DUF6624 domain-containing protein [Flagellimonas halotolerans]|uniref:DUF6624 domain-containing protein n=1 Tax=Flagellimonas halotolerans TaxID=3112164 RepID=A0ABU6IQ56_9FLAO|nr:MULTISPECIES: DUF6624 domain-containing protein [unclassified Allomuricauda]MEC3965085.1 DUF6624 domain-containing protein [Muricauda sp. SYSU M86414]MEC4265070.1 DUF6624 domain-containing protein [Muricauda sp. SYSU M84420]
MYKVFILSVLLMGCKGKDSKEVEKGKVVFNQALADELERMVEVDQIAAYIPQGKYKELSSEAWNAFKDSVFTTHQKRLSQIFEKHGFVGFDLAGENGSRDFWLMVQHSDHVPGFQKEVLDQMKVEVDKGNASPSNYGLLVDRVRLNTGRPQIYGTQVDYNWELCQAFPKTLEDSLNVNQRREAIGLKPLEEYLNQMSEMHFEINKEMFLKKGIKGPKLYKTVKN